MKNQFSHFFQAGVISLAAIVMLSHCGKEKNNNEVQNSQQGKLVPGASLKRLYGTWSLMSSNQDGYKMVSKIKFEAEKVNLIQHCSIENDKVDFTITSKARLTDTEIEILESVKKSEPLSAQRPDQKCSASFEKTKVTYSFNGEKLVLKETDGTTKELNRID